jgi:DNA-binding NarL/FixJ family response regulator
MRILITDDHQLFSSGLSVLLEELSPTADITTANSVAKALNESGVFDLILLDLHLPDADGFNGLIRLKTKFEETPIVIVSSEENPQRIRDSIHCGAMGFVPKASSPDELFNAMRLILGGETYLPPSCIVPFDSQALHNSKAVSLSPRQHEVLMKVIQGKPNKVIARELGISDQTVKSHVMAVLTVMGVNNRTEAVYRAASLGISTTTA